MAPPAPPAPPPPPAPLVFDQQSFMGAIQLLRDQKLRGFRIDIETQSTIAADESQEKQDASELLQTVGAFMQSSLPLAQSMPAVLPVLGKMLLFVVRRHNIGMELESSLEDALDKLEGNPAGALQDPKASEAAMKQQMMQASMDLKRQEFGLKAQLQQQEMVQDSAEHQMALQGRQIEFQGDQIKAEAEVRKALLDEEMAKQEHARQLELAAVQHRAGLVQAMMPAQPATPAQGGGIPLAPQKLPFGAGVMTEGTR